MQISMYRMVQAVENDDFEIKNEKSEHNRTNLERENRVECYVNTYLFTKG